jgi:hypothetical protein
VIRDTERLRGAEYETAAADLVKPNDVDNPYGDGATPLEHRPQCPHTRPLRPIEALSPTLAGLRWLWLLVRPRHLPGTPRFVHESGDSARPRRPPRARQQRSANGRRGQASRDWAVRGVGACSRSSVVSPSLSPTRITAYGEGPASGEIFRTQSWEPQSRQLPSSWGGTTAPG